MNTTSLPHTVLSLAALALLASPLAAQSSGTPPLGFDLVRINDDGNPADPGIDYDWYPVSEQNAESAGIAVADIDNDGNLDVVMGANETQNTHVYMNNGDGTFTESALALGVDETTLRRGNHLLFDYDNDGDLDMASFGYPGYPYYNYDLYSFYRNDGAPGYGFTDVTSGVGGFVFGPSVETTTIGIPGGAAAADYDNDGFVDMINTYWFWNSVAVGLTQDQFRLWHNTSNPNPDQGEPDYSSRLFEDVTQAAGLDGEGYGWIWMPTFVDIDRDGLVDLHINVETGEDLMLLNNGDGTFADNIATDIGLNFNFGEQTLVVTGPNGNEMGATWSDYDNDGDFDLYLTNVGNGQDNKNDGFYRNDSDLSEGGTGLEFNYIGESTVAETSYDPGWGIVFPDLDNDGDQDIVTSRGLANVINLIGRQYIWRNNSPATSTSGNVEFEDVTFSMTGLSACWDAARSLVAFDYDNDGDQDLLMNRTGHTPLLPYDKVDAAMYRNEALSAANWLQLDLVESGGSLNTIGARVYVRTGGVQSGPVQMREVFCGSSFLAQEPSRLSFGLRFFSEADFVVVRWADGAMTALTASTDDLSGLIEIQRGADVYSGDLNADVVVDETDLELLVTSLVDPLLVDAQVPLEWPWRITADLDGNGLVDRRDFHLLRPMVRDTWADIGQSMDGTSGAPVLTGTGTLVDGTLVSLDTSNALPGSLAWLFLGFDLGVLPLKDGIAVPTFDFEPIGPLPVSGTGDVNLSVTWPAGVPSGSLIYYQTWVADPGGPKGAAASNALSSISP
jgi:hypothetical protein